ncbi:MAG: glycosyltransferase family 4 protein [Syntrophorhabdaceae bacterium]|nr:glycosyltransferase family 4 protein [Syntrophorhabdaceae bacterium]
MLKSKNIWVISELYYPEETSTGHYMTKIAEALAKELSVKVLSSKPNYASRGIYVPRREIHNNVEIYRCFSTTFNKNNLFLRIINIVTISLSIFITCIIKMRRGDIVLVVTNPPLLPYIAVFACLMRKSKCLIRIDDVYPDILVVSDIISRNGILFNMLNRSTKYLYKKADCIITLGRDMRSLVANKMNGNNNSINVITNWADVDEVSPIPKATNNLLKELGLFDKFVVQCAGNIGRVQGIECLFAVAKQLKVHKDIHFLFIGSGAKKEWLVEQIEKSNMKNITVLGNRPRSDQVNFLNACDIAVVSLMPGMLGVSVPSRMYNIFAAGKPIIAIVDENSEVALTVEEERLGWVATPDDPAKIADIILMAKSHPALIEEMGKKARDMAESKYSYKKILNAYLTIMDGMVKS